MQESNAVTGAGFRLSPGWLTFLVGIVILLLAGIMYQQSLISSGAGLQTRHGGPEGPPHSNVKYVCPMRCVESDKPGKCPVCGMEMSPIEIGGPVVASPEVTGGTSAEAVYTCPMHPQVVQDRPGTCPICGMELVLKAAAPAAGNVDLSALKGVHLSPEQEVLANVTPVKPSRENMALSVPAIGEVTIPQGQMREVVAWQDGRIDNLLLDETGGTVREGQHIMDIYSEELVQAQEEYLIALKAVDELGDSGYESIARSTKGLLEASRSKLIRQGMKPAQLAKLEETRKVVERVPIYAKEGGVVLEKNISEGMYVMKGEELFTVANLSPIWVEVRVFEKDAANVRVGDRVSFTSPVEPGRKFSGKVELIEPLLEEATRTFKLRVSVSNPGLKLRPGMILDATINFDYGDLLLLPRDAVLHTGDGDLVYVKAKDGTWQPRKVTVGRDFGARIEIVSGVSAGDDVAGSAVFLLDSEAQLQGIERPVGGE